MIIETNDLSSYNGKFTMVDGCFDPVHSGHLLYFEEAAKLGYPVLCNVACDDYVKIEKSRATLLPESQRARLLDSIEVISAVHINYTTTADVLDKLKPAKYVKGSDWKIKGLPEDQKNYCTMNGIAIVYLDTVIDSSSGIVDKFSRSVCRDYVSGCVKDYEEFVLSQKPFEAVYYDEKYFEGDWRKKEESYSIEKRRQIEAKNPINIKNVFGSKTVLDVGCGPGALMLFLHELGMDVYGIDFSQSAKDIAPEQVKDRIRVNDVCQFYDFKKQFDLVVCREVIEHLTVLQVRKLVRVLAEYTCKYLYITTRFHPNPSTLFDVTTEPGVDLSHITCMNKDFLRTLFVLEGLKSRPDLEQKMDWKNVGRVMVFEK
jgi:cytidyltransferase-like protein